jgi:PleD family two-component response regulator
MPESKKKIEKVTVPQNEELDKAYKILTIDDDQWIIKLLARQLSIWGFKPIGAADAFEGIAQAIKHKPLLIILDLILPEVKGDALLKMFKKIDEISDIPVLILSGNLNKEIVGKTFKDGAFGYISKPFTSDILLEKIRESIKPEILSNLPNLQVLLKETNNNPVL